MGKYLDASGVTYLWGKAKATFAPISHTHGNITNDGKLKSGELIAGNKAVITDANGVIIGGTVSNSMLTNSKITIAGNEVSLGGSITKDTLRSSLGLTNALYFAGVCTTAIGDGSTGATIDVKKGTGTESITAVQGAVVIKDGTSQEYVYANGAWELFGDEGAYALKTNTVNGIQISNNPDLFTTDPSTAATVGHVLVLADTTNHKYKDSGFTIGKSVPSNAVFTDTETLAAASTTVGGIIGTIKHGSDSPVTFQNGIAESSTNGYISSCGSDVKVYTHPTAGSKSTTKSASGATATAGSTVQVVTGVEIDASGHVTGVTSGAASDTTYSVVTAAANGLAPKFDACAGVIENSDDQTWVLAKKPGETTADWYQLPGNAFKDTVYSHPAVGTTSTAITGTAGTASATTVITGISRDASGHVNAFTTSDISAAYVDSKNLLVAASADNGTSNSSTTHANNAVYLNLLEGDRSSTKSVVDSIKLIGINPNITVAAKAGVVEIKHTTADTGSAATATAGTAAANTVITGVSIDTNGHVTGVTTSDISTAYNKTAVSASATATTGDEVGSVTIDGTKTTFKNGMVALTAAEIDAAIAAAN